MKPKKLGNGMFNGIITIVALVAFLAFACWYSFEHLSKPIAIVISVVMALFVIRTIIKSPWLFQTLEFNEKGFTFHYFGGKKAFCSWDSIERAEYFRTKNALIDGNKYYRPVYIAVYTADHHVAPEMNENGVVLNCNRNGKKYRVNHPDDSLAWVMGPMAGSCTAFKEYFAKYRPDLFIERDESVIYDEMLH